MGNKATALAVLGKGLLDFGANRENLRFEREREANFMELQRRQMDEAERAALASEQLQRDTLTETTRSNKASEANEGKALLSQLQRDESAIALNNAQITDLGKQRELNKAEADIVAEQAGLKWDPQQKTYVHDEDAYERMLTRLKEKYSYGGGTSSWEAQVNARAENLIALRDGGDENLKGMSDAQLRRQAMIETNTAKVRPDGDIRAQIDFWKTRVTSLTTQLKSSFGEDKARLQAELDTAITQYNNLINSQAGAGLLVPGGGAPTGSAFDSFRQWSGQPD